MTSRRRHVLPHHGPSPPPGDVPRPSGKAVLDFSAGEIEAVRLSLRVAFWAMLGSLPFGLAMAMVLARGRFWGKSLLDGIVHLPLVMPPVVTGYLLLLLFGRHGPLGRFLAETLRHRLRVPLDRCGARLRR